MTKRAPHSRASVRQLLLWLVLTCLLPGVVGVGVLVERMYRDTQEQTEKDTVRIARAMVHAVDAELAKIQSVAVALATSSLLSSGDLQAFHGRASALLRNEDIGANVVLSDASGQQVLNTLRPFGAPLLQHGNREQLQRVSATAQPAVSNVFVSGTTGKPVVSVDVLVPRLGNVPYLLSIILPLESFNMLLRNQDLPLDWVSSITDGQGTTVARSKQAELLVGTQANSALLQSLRDSREGVYDTITKDGIPAVAAFSRSAKSGWTVAIALPKAGLWAPWQEKLMQIGIAMAALFALGCYLAWRQGGRIALSVQRLTEAALAMQGDKTPAVVAPLHFAEAEIAALAIHESSRSLAHREQARIEAHDALLASKAMLDAALSSMTDAVCIADTSGQLVEMNAVFGSFYRFTDGQSCSTTFADYSAIFELSTEDGCLVPFDEWPLCRALRGEGGSNVSFRLQRKDTGVSWFTRFSFAPIRAIDESIVGAVVVARDSTEQAEREQALAQASTRLELAQRASGAGLWDWDVRAGSFAWSKAMYQLFQQYPFDSSIDFDAWLKLVHPDDRAHVQDTMLTCVQIHLPLNIRYRILLPSGELRWIESKADTVYDTQGQALRMSGICIDATFRQQADDDRLTAQRLESENFRILEASRLKNQFFANMSHELRTPLGAIVGFADLIHSGALEADDAKRQKFVGYIRKSALHLSRLIDDVLDLAKVDAAMIQFFPEPVELNSLIREVRDTLHPLLLERRMSVSVVTDDTVIGLQLDPARLKQVLYNYLSNAIKFSGDGSHICVRALPHGAGHFRIEVEDVGIGIAEESQSRLFVDFQQLDTGYAKRFQGTGLGLSLTRRLVEAQGGSVGVRSTPGVGSVFFVVLKRVHEPGSSTLNDVDKRGVSRLEDCV